MSDDIVTRLRLTPTLMKCDKRMMSEAADEIERLRDERDGYLIGNQQALRALAEANEIAQTLKRQRDEARQWLCEVLAKYSLLAGLGVPGKGTKYDFAAEQGWKCFKESTDGK
jgi:hypothetical protein